MNLYEREAVLCDSGGQPVSGLDAIRRGYAAILRSKPQVKVQTKYAIRMGDIALLRADWEMTGISPDGKPLHSAHHSTEVVRRQPDGTWCYVIDHPFGAD